MTRNDRHFRNTYYVLRHGQSVANVAALIVSSPGVGLCDYGLTDDGRKEVGRSVEASRHPIAAADAIYSSDFLRTRETAEIASELLSAPVELTPALRERFFGDWDGSSNSNYNRVWTQDRTDPDHCQRAVESVTSVAQRMTGWLDEIENSHSDKVFLIVSHGDPLQILMTAVAGLDLRLHRQIPSLRTAELRSLVLGDGVLARVSGLEERPNI